LPQPLRVRVAVLCLGLLICAQARSTAASAQASDYPSRKITFMVGFAPGGGIDTFARVLAQELAEHAGYQIVIENRAGAGSNIAAKLVANASPDGHTLLVAGGSYAINQTLYKDPGYATADLVPVAFVALDSQALAVNADNPARTLAELLAAGKSKSLTFGFGGSAARIAAEYVFHVLAKANAAGVPFQSGAPALNALLGHHVDVNVGPVAETYPMVRQGTVRALAVTGPHRAEALPDVPTLDELGFTGIGINGWIGVLAPAKTPPDVLGKVNAAIGAAIARPTVDARLRTLGYEPYHAAFAEAPAFLKQQVETWGRLIQATGITAE
jgi:tripartite-type tricarboxylate transporter receptor subunit TctC